jgi:hypothetical protein
MTRELDEGSLDALLAHAEAAAERATGRWDATEFYVWFTDTVSDPSDPTGQTPMPEQAEIARCALEVLAVYIAACDPDTIRSLVQRVKDAEAETRRVIEHVEGADELAVASFADRDRLLTALAALADTADQQATDDLGNLNDSGRVVPLGLVPTRKIRDLIHAHGGTT